MVVERKRTNRKNNNNKNAELPTDTGLVNVIEPAGSAPPTDNRQRLPESTDDVETGPRDVTPSPVHKQEKHDVREPSKGLDGHGNAGGGDESTGDRFKGEDGGGVVDMGHPSGGDNEIDKGGRSDNRKRDSKRGMVKKIYIIGGGRDRGGGRGRERGGSKSRRIGDKKRRDRTPESESESSETDEDDTSDSDSSSSDDSVVRKYTKPKRTKYTKFSVNKTDKKKKKITKPKPKARESSESQEDDSETDPETDVSDSPPPRPRFKMPSFRFI